MPTRLAFEQEAVVDAELALSFAGVTGDDASWYAREGLAPPFFVVRPLIEGLTSASGRGEKAFSSLVLHAQQEMRFRRLPRLGERLVTRFVVDLHATYGMGPAITVASWVHGEHGSVAEMETVLRKSGLGPGGAAQKRERVSRLRTLAVERRAIDASLPARYSHVSGDLNPIHLDQDVARAFGLPGVILQGLCTMAMASTVAVSELAGGDPQRLEGMRVRFARPVVPPCVLEVELSETAEPGLFGLTARVGSSRVLRDGVVRIRGHTSGRR